jgi:Fe-S cluster biogenesis protein NfuA
MIYTEITPNPASLKFVVQGKRLIKGRGYDYPDQQSAGGSPLAQAIFALGFSKGVFVGPDFITVTKGEGNTWEEIIPGVKNELKNFLDSGKEAVFDEPENNEEISADDSEIVAKIKQLLEQNIRPAVAMDGGDVVFESFTDGIVKLQMRGSCSGCPSSVMTLKMGIEGLLTRMIPEVKQVEAI